MSAFYMGQTVEVREAHGHPGYFADGDDFIVEDVIPAGDCEPHEKLTIDDPESGARVGTFLSYRFQPKGTR